MTDLYIDTTADLADRLAPRIVTTKGVDTGAEAHPAVLPSDEG